MSKKLGTLVKEARTEKGLTQAALAKKVKGLTASDISKIERGEKEPDKDTIKELAKTLGVTQTSLLNAASGNTTAQKSEAKTTTAKKTTAKKTAAKKTTAKTGGTATTSAADLKLTAAEKKLVQLYRKADTDTKKAAVSVLDGSASITDLLGVLLHEKTSAGTSSKPASGLQDLLGSLLGSGADQNAGKDSSAIGSLLEGLLGKRG